MPDHFLGAWLVSEYVFNPDGGFAGIVRQRRALERLDSGLLRVTQRCEPGPELAAHPMGRFSGELVFELSVDGRSRRYHGPDVIGTGLAWGEGAMTGRGLWPNFGHNFRSFAVLPHAHMQLTGGKFFNSSEMIANIVGIAVPEEGASGWPELNGPHWPGEVATEWRGSLRRVAADGTVLGEHAVVRRYSGQTWEEQTSDETPFILALEAWGQRLRVEGSIQGIGKRYGWLLEVEGLTEPGVTLELMEVLDAAGGHLIGLRRWLRDDTLERVEVLRLKSQPI